MKRCSKCILPETIPNITFDENSVCNYCIEYNAIGNKPAIDYERKIEQFREFVNKAKENRIKNGFKYDVLVPLSGGRDSSYVAWSLSKTLKILCVHYENPFASLQAKTNVEHLIKIINTDVIYFSYPKQQHEKSFKNNLKAWIKRPELYTLGLMCLACKPMYLEFFKIARKNNISLIVDGSNPNEATIFKKEAQRSVSKKNLFFTKEIINMGRKAIRNYRYLKGCNVIPAINTFLSINGNTPYLRWRYKNIVKLGYFYFHPYIEKEIDRTLKNIGWEKAKDNKSPWRFDCEIDAVKNFLYNKLINATEKDDLFSRNIRWGLMTREEAIERLEEGEVNIDVLKRVLEKVQMELSDIEIVG